MRVRILVGALLVALLLTACSSPGSTGASQTAPEATTPATPGATASTAADADPDRPLPAVPLNVIVVVVDDASDVSCARTARFLPRISRLLRDRGRCYENATVTTPACCPSRANLQTSQMGHNSGVRRQIDAPLLRTEDTIQDDLTHAGYETYGTGKYFNGISPWLFESGELSSGFVSSDFWASSKYYDYPLWDDEAGDYGVPEERVHATTRTGQFLRGFIRRAVDGERPFYAYAAFKAPHTDNSAPNDRLRMPRPTMRNRDRPVPPFRVTREADTRDKLSIFGKQLRSRAYYQRLYAARTRAMYDVDDELGRTFELLRREGILYDTAILLTSDNGYHLGENNWETKGDPYPAAMDVPLLAWLPSAFGRGVVDTRPVGLIDIAPTLYQLLDVEPEHLLDGRSLLSPVRRRDTFFEMQNEKTRIAFNEGGLFPGRVPTWARYTSGSRTYIEYYDARDRRIRREFYRDPAMERNVLWRGNRRQRPSAETIAWFAQQLRRGRTCAGTAEQGSPNPCP